MCWGQNREAPPCMTMSADCGHEHHDAMTADERHDAMTAKVNDSTKNDCNHSCSHHAPCSSNNQTHKKGQQKRTKSAIKCKKNGRKPKKCTPTSVSLISSLLPSFLLTSATLDRIWAALKQVFGCGYGRRYEDMG